MNRKIAILSLTHLAALLVGFLLVSLVSKRTAETAISKENVSYLNYLRKNLPILVDESNKDLNLSIAKRLNKIMGREGYPIHEAKRNLGCTFWVSSDEIPFDEGPPIDRYLIIIGDPFAVFYFSSEAAGKKGLDHLERSILKDNQGMVYLPEGIMTNFRVYP